MSRYLLRIALLFLAGTVAAGASTASDEALCREAYRWVSAEYYRPVDEQAFMQACPNSLDKVLNKYSKLVRVDEQTSRGEVAHLGMEVKLKADRPVVALIYEVFSAAKADIRIGDVILEIDGVSTQGMALAEVHNACVGLLVQR